MKTYLILATGLVGTLGYVFFYNKGKVVEKGVANTVEAVGKGFVGGFSNFGKGVATQLDLGNIGYGLVQRGGKTIETLKSTDFNTNPIYEGFNRALFGKKSQQTLGGSIYEFLNPTFGSQK